MRVNPVMSLAFDLIRVLSIFAVVIGHYVAIASMYDVSGLPFPIQSYGVVTMFMLSGFLIVASISAKTDGFVDFRRYRFTDFLIDRGSRIFVVYWPVLVTVVVANNWFATSRGIGIRSSGISNAIVSFFMMQLHPILPAGWQPRVDTMDPTWALTLEWWIYLLVGWVVLVVVAQVKQSRRPELTGRARVSIWAYVVAAVLAVYTIDNLVSPGASAVPWFAGAALFFAHDKIAVTSKTRWAYAGAAVVLFVACMYVITSATTGYAVTGVYSTGSYVLTAGWFLCLLVFSRGCADRCGPVLRWSTPPLRYASGYMYSLFLTHFTVWYYIEWIDWQFVEAMTARGRIAFVFVVANVVAVVIGLLLERRGRAVGARIKRHLRRSTTAASRRLA